MARPPLRGFPRRDCLTPWAGASRLNSFAAMRRDFTLRACHKAFGDSVPPGIITAMQDLMRSRSVTRRTLLGLGSLALGGVNLSQILAAQHAQGVRDSDRSVILVWLYGGPTQLETYDLKPLAPS